MHLRLNVNNWLKQMSYQKGDIIPTTFAIVVTTTAWMVNRKRNSDDQFILHMVTYDAPDDAVLKLPGIYVTREKKEVNLIEQKETTDGPETGGSPENRT